MHRRRLIQLSVVALGAAVAPVLVANEAAAFRDKDCSDFRSQRKAQKFYKRVKRRKGGDPHNLDADNDGVACEDLR